MTGSFRLGYIAGIEVKVHVTFFLLIAWVVLVQTRRTGDLSAGLAWAAFVLVLFGCVVLHELGHALVARRFGVQTRDIVLLPIGGVARLERIPEEPRQEMLIAIAGPLVNVAIAALLLLVLGAQGVPILPASEAAMEGSLLLRLAVVNIFLFVFNLLPAFPMDGGRILRALLAMRGDYLKATRSAAQLGRMVAVGLGFLGLLANPFLVLIALFVWIGAAAEVSAVEMRGALAGMSVRAVMETRVAVLGPQDPLDRAVELTLADRQRDFPVVDARGVPLGLLTQNRLLHALSEGGRDQLVESAMQQDLATAGVGELAVDVVNKLQEGGHSAVLIVDGMGHLEGLLTLENVSEYLAFERAYAAAGGHAAAGSGPVRLRGS